MAEVYVGRHITEDGTFGPMVAVKRLLPHLIRDQAIVRMFLNEARITAQIEHPNVVRIVDLGHEAGEPYIAMELLDGHTFADLRERVADDGKRVPIGITLTILTEACRGLDAAHRAVDERGQPLRLVHRDFTPDNIHVGFKGEVKVIDFGVAKTAMWGAGTEPGTLKGKFFYMSPEMILAKPVDHRADVFAAGVMLYEQLCGRRPFTGNSVDEVVMRIAQGNPRPPHELDPAVPRPLEDVCLKAVEHDPDKRYQTLQELIDAISAIGGEAQLATREATGEYVSKTFPQNKDAKRDTLRKAREHDPSYPGPPSPYAGSPISPGASPSMAPTQPPGSTLGAEPPTGPKMNPAPPNSPKPIDPAQKALLKKVGVAGAVALVLGLLVVVVPKLGLSATPDEALAKAQATKDPKERAALLDDLAEKNATGEQLEQAGKLLLEVKAGPGAARLAEAWRTREPNNPKAWLLEARAAILTRKGKRVESALEQARDLAKNDPEPFVVMAEFKETLGEPMQALDAWASALARKPDEVRFKARIGYWQSQAGQLDQAQVTLGQVLQKQFDPVSAAELGFVKFRKGDPGGAARTLKEVIKKDPTSMAAHYYLGAVLYQQRDAKGARAEYLEADKLAPTDSRPLIALCEMEAQTNAPELEETKKAIATRFEDGKQLVARCAAAAPPPAD
ncbi:MAG: protein kinase [Myxococcaceae bacterium]|nr:protein kinase [Myxococcaceae bacterium]